jgi:hypothetical protein
VVSSSSVSQNKTSLLVAEDHGDAEQKSPGEILCKACDMEASFVHEGMVPCPHCGITSYCSSQCLEWDWKSTATTRTTIIPWPCVTCLTVFQAEKATVRGAVAAAERQLHPLTVVLFLSLDASLLSFHQR